jgi:trans-aconitate 2-methyltransferase
LSESDPPRAREWNSSAYHRISGPQFEWGKKVVARLSLRGDETVLDAGCGTGRLTAELLRRLPRGRVVAVDLSQNMVQTARQQLRPGFKDRVSAAVADLQNLPFCEAFDGVFSTAVFHWLPDHDQLFKSLFTALRRGGWLEAQCGGGPNLARLRKRIAALSAAPPFSAYLSGFDEHWIYSDPETTAARLDRAGFQDINTWGEPAPTGFENERQYREFLATAVLHRRLERLPTAQLRDLFLNKLSEQAAADNPPFELDYWRLNLSAKKPF